MSVTRWAILTGEYPPQAGGVSDYTQLVARGLAASGDPVTVYAPPSLGQPDAVDSDVAVCRLPDHFGPRGLFVLDRAIAKRPRPDRLLIQYVPHSYGWKAMNLPFVLWVALRARHLAPVWVMFHEVAFPFRWRPATHAVIGACTRLMARLVAGAADRVFVSIPAWSGPLRRMCPHVKPAEWLPIPSNIPVAAPSGMTAPAFSARGVVIGHFGTYGRPIAALLEPALVRLMAKPDRVAILIGRGGPEFLDGLVARHPNLAGCLIATGDLSPEDVAVHLRACDLLLQPFIDGISSRRTSAMAGLANAVPMVSNLGHLSESFWANARGVRVAPSSDPESLARTVETVLCLTPAERKQLGREAARLYRSMFGIEQTIARLLGGPASLWTARA